MNPKLTETIYVDFITSSPTTGAAIDADSLPTAEVFEDATDTAILSPTIVKRTGKTGNYRVPVVCTAANGFEAAKSYNVVVSATVGAVAAKAVIRTFQMRTTSVDDPVVVGTNNDKTGYALTAAYDPAKTASSQATQDTLATYVDTEVAAIKAKTDNLPASPAATGAAMTLTSAYDAAKTAATQASVDAIKTVVDAVKVIEDRFNTMVVLDGAVYQYTANALELGPAGGGGGGDASQATLLAVKAKTDALPADPADASDIAAQFATVNSALATLSSYVDTEVAAILAKTNNLPADPASTSAINSQFSVTNSKIDVVDDYIDTEVLAIKAKTDQLTFTGGKVDANSTLSLVAGDLTAIADAILKRDWTSVSGEAAYSLLNAARMLRNVWNTTSGVLSVKKEDGTTNAWQRTLAVDPTAQPIVGAT